MKKVLKYVKIAVSVLAIAICSYGAAYLYSINKTDCFSTTSQETAERFSLNAFTGGKPLPEELRDKVKFEVKNMRLLSANPSVDSKLCGFDLVIRNTETNDTMHMDGKMSINKSDGFATFYYEVILNNLR